MIFGLLVRSTVSGTSSSSSSPSISSRRLCPVGGSVAAATVFREIGGGFVVMRPLPISGGRRGRGRGGDGVGGGGVRSGGRTVALRSGCAASAAAAATAAPAGRFGVRNGEATTGLAESRFLGRRLVRPTARKEEDSSEWTRVRSFSHI